MRYWEIDIARGMAVILMVIFNWSFALEFLNVLSLQVGWLYWWLFPRIIASAFIFIAGMSFSISYAKNQNPRKHIKRGLKILGIGMLATVVTYILYPQYTILFGILHLIGLSIILGPYLARMKYFTLAAGIILIATGIAISGFSFNSPYLLILGIPASSYSSFDYFPIVPWLGVFLIGMFIGMKAYKGGKRNFKIIEEPFAAKPLGFLGRHSLLIYIIHQPALLAILFALGFHVF